MSFFYEEAASFVERSAVGSIGFVVPEPKRRKDGQGRPWASNRACFQGILWVLLTGARWRDLPASSLACSMTSGRR
jgi:transposase